MIIFSVQGDYFNMAVCFWYPVKRDLSSAVYTCTEVYKCTVAYTGQVSFYKVPEKNGHLNLVTLYITFLFR